MVNIERILLIRHGQTDWNVAGRWQGIEPTPLNEEGWTQAEALAQHLKGRSIGSIFCSDLPRAFQTASAIGRHFEITPQVDERWREFNLGVFQGYTRDEIQQHFPDEWIQFRDNYWDYAVPNGETRRAFLARLYDAWTDVMQTGPGPEIVVVSHGGAIKLLLMKLFENNAQVQEALIANTSFTTIARDEGQWTLAGIASVPHLASTLKSDSY